MKLNTFHVPDMSSTSIDAAFGNLSLRMLFSNGSPVSVLLLPTQFRMIVEVKPYSELILLRTIQMC